MDGVIITSARYQSALAVARCLGRHGIKVACGEDRRAKTAIFPLAFYSQYCAQRFTYPSYQDDADGFIQAIVDFARKEAGKYGVLMPIDAETIVISRYRERIEAEVPHLKIPVHEHEYLTMANDKAKVMALAHKIGAPTPKTHILSSPDEVGEVAGKVAYPAVIKLPSSKGSKGFGIAHNKEELIQKYGNTLRQHHLRTGSELPLIQEYIPGRGYGVSFLFNQGEMRARFTHRRLRESFATGGPSVLRISTSHPEMEEYATRLLEALKWHGVAMVEFRLDERDSTPKLIEINPRFWGSLYLAISAGVEFPWLLYQMALHGDVSPITHYKIGVRARFLWGDLRSFPGNFSGASNKLRFVKEFFAPRRETYDDLSLRDPVPALVQVLNPIARLLATGHMRGE